VKRRRKRTPKEEAAFREFRRQADEHERRLRELVAKAWAEIEERRKRERRKRTPEQEARFQGFRRQVQASERRLRELVAKAEREERRGREQQAGA
jgi:hypothetical protein